MILSLSISILFIASFKLVVASSLITKELEFTQVSAALENVYVFQIKKEKRHVFLYNINDEEIINNPLRNSLKIFLSAEQNPDIDVKCPLTVTLWHEDTTFSWNLSATKNKTGHNTIESTVCMDFTNKPKRLKYSSDSEQLLTVEVTTCSTIPISYTLSLHLRRDFLIPFHSLIRAEFTPKSPAVYRYKFPDTKSDYAFIQLSSTSDACMIMSVQQPICPFNDQDTNIEMHGSWQTITTKTGMSISKKDYPNGFFLVFILLSDDSRCQKLFGDDQLEKPNNVSKSIVPRIKTVNFLIRDDVANKEYHLALLIPLGCFLSFATLIFVLHLHFHRFRCDLYKDKAEVAVESSNSVDVTFSAVSVLHGSTDSILRSRIQISELINSHPERLMEQSKRYYMAGLLAASFYCLPVFQLILSFQNRLQETGNFDMCYFNYLCSHMFWIFHDFNHIYSNIGYIICGTVYIGIVFLRQHTLTPSLNYSSKTSTVMPIYGPGERLQNETNAKEKPWIPKAPWDISKGVFVHHGLYYSMGFSLLMTGVMSAAYHICPNQNNFQFDTAFMYTIAALTIVTIYQFRHPTYVSATLTFMTLAIVAASTVLGLMWENMTFRVLFSITHFVFLLVILTYIHYVGYIRTNGVTVTEWKEMFKILRQKWLEDIRGCRVFRFQRDVWSPSEDSQTVVLPGPCRLVFPILVIGINLAALAMIWTVMKQANFASQVLAVYIINSSVYTIYYSIMKAIHRECRGKLWLQPFFYLTIALCLWGYSLFFFGDVVTLWERSPAESRAHNAECMFLGFYDTHDVWHFISAAAMFSSLMALLTMDDDLVNQPKSMIPVF